jgi:hypothetical protein
MKPRFGYDSHGVNLVEPLNDERDGGNVGWLEGRTYCCAPSTISGEGEDTADGWRAQVWAARCMESVVGG